MDASVLVNIESGAGVVENSQLSLKETSVASVNVHFCYVIGDALLQK